MRIHLHVDSYSICQLLIGLKGICTSDQPVIVPWTIDPFFSSIVTVSLFNFIKNL